VTNKDETEVSLAADAAGLELLEPSSGQARQKQRKVLDSEIIIPIPGPLGEAVVLVPIV
jgi:hypothetical protein